MKSGQQWNVNSFVKKNYKGSLQTYSVKGTVRTYSEPSLKEKFIEFMEPRIREEDRESFSRAVLDLTNDEFLDFLNNENSEDKEVIEFKEVLDNEGYSKRCRSKGSMKSYANVPGIKEKYIKMHADSDLFRLCGWEDCIEELESVPQEKFADYLIDMYKELISEPEAYDQDYAKALHDFLSQFPELKSYL